MSAYAFFVQLCREEHKRKHPNQSGKWLSVTSQSVRYAITYNIQISQVSGYMYYAYQSGMQLHVTFQSVRYAVTCNIAISQVCGVLYYPSLVCGVV